MIGGQIANLFRLTTKLSEFAHPTRLLPIASNNRTTDIVCLFTVWSHLCSEFPIAYLPIPFNQDIFRISNYNGRSYSRNRTMIRQQISRKTSSTQQPSPISQNSTPSRSFCPLSGVVQRAQNDSASVSRDEWQQLDSAIGTRATKGILSGAQTQCNPTFTGISTELGSNSGWGGLPIQAKRKRGQEKNNLEVSKRSNMSQGNPAETGKQAKLSVQRHKTVQRKEATIRSRIESPRSDTGANEKGLPISLKAGIENLSGYSMDDVRVHYNSPKPKQIQALAYTQGTEIHVGPGQEKYLPHEAWHAVQQKQGRVKPTIQMKGGVKGNDDQKMEKEADMMGARALQKYALNGFLQNERIVHINDRNVSSLHNKNAGIIQRCENSTKSTSNKGYRIRKKKKNPKKKHNEENQNQKSRNNKQGSENRQVGRMTDVGQTWTKSNAVKGMEEKKNYKMRNTTIGD